MYKSSEPITSLHSVQKHMANIYSSEVCKVIFFKTLQNMMIIKNYQYFYKNNSQISDKVWKLRTNFGWTSETTFLRTEWSDVIGSELLYIPSTEYKTRKSRSWCFCKQILRFPLNESFVAGSLESANSSILPARNLFKDFGGEKIRILC